MSTEIEFLAVPLLKGSLALPITDQPAVIIIYVLLLVIIGAALASVLSRNLLFAIASFSLTMVGVALLYLIVAPFLLFAVQLLIFTTVSAGFLIGLLRMTSSLEPSPESPFSPELISGVAVGAALLALLGVVVGATNWPVSLQRGAFSPIGFGNTLTDTYVVGIAVLVVLIASAALGVGLLATQRLGPRARASVTTVPPRGGRRTRPPVARP